MGKKHSFLVVAFIIANVSCKKESNSPTTRGSEPKAYIHFVDFVTGEPVKGLSVEVGYKNDTAFVVKEQLVTDNNGTCTFTQNSYSVLVKPVSNVYYDLAENDYYSLASSNTYSYFTLEKQDGNESFYRAMLFRKGRSTVQITQLRSYPLGDELAGVHTYFSFNVLAYRLTDTLEIRSVVQLPGFSCRLHKGILLDTTIEIDVFGDIYNRMEWSIQSVYKQDDPHLMFEGITPARIFNTGVNDKITVSF